MDKTILQSICIATILILTSFATSTEAVAGGELANFQEFPHLVQLYSTAEGDLFCGGSILEENVVLTAAHCLVVQHPFMKRVTFMMSSNSILVTAGSLELRNIVNVTDIDTEENEIQTRTVSHFILHPDFDYFQGKHDLALLFLKKPLKFNRNIRPISLPSPTNETFIRGTFAGWGNQNGLTWDPIHLRKLSLVFGKTDSCNAEFSWVPSPKLITDDHICAKFGKGVGICKGDSGSSLVCEEQQRIPKFSFPVVCGVASMIKRLAKTCGGGNSVAVFTDVSKYLDWIYDTTEKEGFQIKKVKMGCFHSEAGFSDCGSAHQCLPNFPWFVFPLIAILVNYFFLGVLASF